MRGGHTTIIVVSVCASRVRVAAARCASRRSTWAQVAHAGQLIGLRDKRDIAYSMHSATDAD